MAGSTPELVAYLNGELIPKDEESYNHGARVCAVGVP